MTAAARRLIKIFVAAVAITNVFSVFRGWLASEQASTFVWLSAMAFNFYWVQDVFKWIEGHEQ